MSSHSPRQNMAGGAVSTSGGGVNIPGKNDKERAMREALECLQAVHQEGFELDGFNLLGVVADPRRGMLPTSSTHGSGSPRRPATAPQQHTDEPGGLSSSAAVEGAASPPPTGAPGLPSFPSSVPEEEPQPDVFTDAVHSLEETFAQVTEQIETFNLFLEELSREYLGDDGGESLYLEYYYQDEEVQLQIPETPKELQNLQLTDLQNYLERSGVLAHSLFAKALSNTSDQDLENLQQHLSQIPMVFSQEDFDLTNSETFKDLLMLQQKQETGQTGDGDDSKPSNAPPKNSLYQPTSELVPLKDPDALAVHLDKVELALQEQVRQKAGVFFQETTRFRQLQTAIEELLRQVQIIRDHIQQILGVYRQTKDVSTHQRQNYEQLVYIMDSTMELLRCKASIGGFLSANDHVGAAQQIQYGRRLLAGESFDKNGGNTNDIQQTTQILELSQLAALSTSGEQFKQYESLVIQSLSEELVEIFFHWTANDGERVQEMVEALNLCRAMKSTGELYQRRLQQMIRMTVRTTIAEFVESSSGGSGGGGSGVTGMAYQSFYDCLQLLIEELQTIMKMAKNVDTFCDKNNIFRNYGGGDEAKRWTEESVSSAADLASKSIAELLRLRKEAHSLITLAEMKQLWDTCIQFTEAVEEVAPGVKATGLRSTLVGQAKAFIDRTHESNMSSLVAALDSERWTQCEISAERQAALTRLCTGRAIMTTRATLQRDTSASENGVRTEKKPTADVEGTNYRVVWSCLLLVEMIMTNLSAAAHFKSLAANSVGKIVELLRLFNARATHLVLGAGAIHSAARLKSINAKHLSMVTQSLGMILALLPHIRFTLMAQLPPKQHTLLSDFDKIKKDYVDHSEMVLNKFVTIIGGIVEHGLAPRIANTNFDARARDLPIGENSDVPCCVFLDGVSTNTRKMHQVLYSLLPPDHLQDVFSRIFAYVDQKVPTLFVAAASATSTPNGVPSFHFPSTDDGKRRLLLEVDCTTKKLNGLQGVLPWDFTAVNALERKLDYSLSKEDDTTTDTSSPEENGTTENGSKPTIADGDGGEVEKESPAGAEETSMADTDQSSVTEENPVADSEGGEKISSDADERLQENEGADNPVENGATPTEEGDKPKATDG